MRNQLLANHYQASGSGHTIWTKCLPYTIQPMGYSLAIQILCTNYSSINTRHHVCKCLDLLSQFANTQNSYTKLLTGQSKYIAMNLEGSVCWWNPISLHSMKADIVTSVYGCFLKESEDINNGGDDAQSLGYSRQNTRLPGFH